MKRPIFITLLCAMLALAAAPAQRTSPRLSEAHYVSNVDAITAGGDVDGDVSWSASPPSIYGPSWLKLGSSATLTAVGPYSISAYHPHQWRRLDKPDAFPWQDGNKRTISPGVRGTFQFIVREKCPYGFYKTSWSKPFTVRVY